MKVKSDTAPSCAYVIEPDPADPSRVIIHMYENAEFISPKPYWQYDDYTMSVPYRPDLAEEVEENFDVWLDIAKYAGEIE